MTRLLLVFIPTGLALGWATAGSDAAPIIVLGAFCATFALAWAGTKLFERAGA